jgi:hypothetical protein
LKYILNNLKDKFNNPKIFLIGDFNEKLLKNNLNYDEANKFLKLLENNKLIRIYDNRIFSDHFPI